jgi:hypothetical protein
MNVYCLLAAMKDDLKENAYVEFAMYDMPNMRTESVPLNEWLIDPEDEILKANVIKFDIKTDKNYGYLMFTIFITM